MNIVSSVGGLGMKPCSKCGVPKEFGNFHKQKAAKDGYKSWCKLCGKKWHEANKDRRAESDKKYREANKDRRAESDKKYREANKGHIAEARKKWYGINKEKKLEQCKKYREANKEVAAEYSKKYRENNKERAKERSKKWYERNKEGKLERNRKYHENNKEVAAEYTKKWRKANPDKYRSFAAKRKSAKLNASPPWISDAEKAQIKEFYALAIIQGEATGKEYHVDHIHPLQAPKVVMFEGEMIPLICGLHVPANLQILEASVNCSKQNKFEPYIESECDFTELWQAGSSIRSGFCCMESNAKIRQAAGVD